MSIEQTEETLAYFQRCREGFLRDLAVPKYEKLRHEDRFDSVQDALAELIERQRNAA